MLVKAKRLLVVKCIQSKYTHCEEEYSLAIWSNENLVSPVVHIFRSVDKDREDKVEGTEIKKE